MIYVFKRKSLLEGLLQLLIPSRKRAADERLRDSIRDLIIDGVMLPLRRPSKRRKENEL